MKNNVFIYLIFCFIFYYNPVTGQKLIENKSVTGVCYAGKKTTRIYIPPPEKFLRKNGSKSQGSITVYYSGFSSQAEKAFKYAISILESMLPNDTKTTILARWEKIDNSSVLANSSATALAAGWSIDAFKPLALYPVSLAEKIAGTSLNSDLDGDIVITVNNSVNWYLGTDGKIPAKSEKYDLVTVVLHEICHGLGFFDSMDTDTQNGWYGFNSIPTIYDTFIENVDGSFLTDTLKFSNYSSRLLKELTGGKLFFSGPVFRNITGETRAQIYAPSTWDSGSSISHLDENSTREPNNLMTPYIDKEEAIHDPGKYTTSILGDLGWINTRIIHNPPGDTEEHLSDLDLSVEIKSDTSYNHDKVSLVYSYDGFSTIDTLYMTSLNSDNNFSALVNIPSYNKEIQYYFATEDFFGRSFHNPSLYQVFRYKAFIGTDTIKPTLSHTPAEYYLETKDTIKLMAEARDNIGVDSVYLEYWVNSGQHEFAGLKSNSGSSYEIILKSNELHLKGGDSLRYRIYAVDSAKIANISVSPESGYYSIGIESLGPVVSSYATDFSDAENDFFLHGFVLSKPSGFQQYGLHTTHPYESPEEDGKGIDYIAMLRSPIKFDVNGMLLQYSDITLVEPGEEGAAFGSSDFYDYVVVEASKDFGESWFSLFDGYDSRLNSTWLKTYNSSIADQNSTATGRESMLVKHAEFFDASSTLRSGDTILIRFRLFSDPFANGWGWAIEDLKINPLIDRIEKHNYEPLTLYPNPGKGKIKIADTDKTLSGGKPFRYEVFNSSGISLYKGVTEGTSEIVIDITGSQSGIYIIVLYLDDGIRTFKYSLIR